VDYASLQVNAVILIFSAYIIFNLFSMYIANFLCVIIVHIIHVFRSVNQSINLNQSLFISGSQSP